MKKLFVIAATIPLMACSSTLDGKYCENSGGGGNDGGPVLIHFVKTFEFKGSDGVMIEGGRLRAEYTIDGNVVDINGPLGMTMVYELVDKEGAQLGASGHQTIYPCDE